MSDFVRACSLAELPEQGAFGVELNGTPLVIVRSEGEVYALDEFCTHEEVSLVDGEIYDRTVECWLHGSCFDLRTGASTGPPATKPVPTYPVKVEDGDVYVAVPATAGA